MREKICNGELEVLIILKLIIILIIRALDNLTFLSIIYNLN